MLKLQKKIQGNKNQVLHYYFYINILTIAKNRQSIPISNAYYKVQIYKLEGYELQHIGSPKNGILPTINQGL